MKPFAICLTALFTTAAATAAEPIGLVPFYQVEMRDTTWHPRIRQLAKKTLPHAFENTAAARERLRLCAEWLESGGKSKKPAVHRFNTSDLYKVLEGGALMLRAEPDAELEKLMDGAIAIIARAQKPDGYLYVPHITGAIDGGMGDRPYSFILHSHELYNIGHLYEAAVAYAQATGKTALLAVAEKSAAHVNRVIFEGGDPNYNGGKPVMQAPGHQEIELGLIKLYSHTGKRLYLDMAKKFLDIRGVSYVPEGAGSHASSYAQQHRPTARQREAVGHAVRATYQYAAMAEVDSLLGSEDFTAALDAIWHNIVDTKMHLTGGLGAVPGIEGFGPAYQLPNEDTYLETCAAVGNVFFNIRMFLKYRDARYIDVAEIALLNNCLSGIGLDGTTFFYPNPLEAKLGHRPRSAWFGTACCPSNLARLIPQIPGYLYATSGKHVYTLLYAASKTQIEVGGSAVELRQETGYPYAGNITLHVDPVVPTEFAISLRIPAWAGRQLVPGALYQFSDKAPEWSITINGKRVEHRPEKGFVTLVREWRDGDKIELHLPMPVRTNTCIDRVAANRNRVAFSRGPLVLCAEGIDNDGAVQRFFVDPNSAGPAATVTILDGAPLAGLPQVNLPATELTFAGERPAELKLIPYFAWSNRDRSSMITWIPSDPKLAKPDTTSTKNFKFSKVTASHTCEFDTADAVRMKHTPESSADKSIRRWTSWPQKGKPQWVEIDLGKSLEISSVGVYFYDDGGGVQVPGKWHIETLVAGKWQLVDLYNTDSYSTLPDSYNTVQPAKPLTTDRLRLILNPEHEQTCVGILAVDIETGEPAPD